MHEINTDQKPDREILRDQLEVNAISYVIVIQVTFQYFHSNNVSALLAPFEKGSEITRRSKNCEPVF